MPNPGADAFTKAVNKKNQLKLLDDLNLIEDAFRSQEDVSMSDRRMSSIGVEE